MIKDFRDVQGIVEHARIDLKTAEMHEIFVRYGTEELYHEMKVACDQQ